VKSYSTECLGLNPHFGGQALFEKSASWNEFLMIPFKFLNFFWQAALIELI
jgi:hypothetical protein